MKKLYGIGGFLIDSCSQELLNNGFILKNIEHFRFSSARTVEFYTFRRVLRHN